MNWIFKVLPIMSTGFCLYVIWVVIERERLNVQTANFAATKDIYIYILNLSGPYIIEEILYV